MWDDIKWANHRHVRTPTDVFHFLAPYLNCNSYNPKRAFEILPVNAASDSMQFTQQPQEDMGTHRLSRTYCSPFVRIFIWGFGRREWETSKPELLLNARACTCGTHTGPAVGRTSDGQMKAPTSRPPWCHRSRRLAVRVSRRRALTRAGQSDPLSLQRAAVQSVDLWAAFEFPFISPRVPLSLHPWKTHKGSEMSREAAVTVLIMAEAVSNRKH